MWKFIILLAAGYCLYKLFAKDFLKKRQTEEKKDQEEIEKKVKCGELVKDPECGAYVSAEQSISVRDGSGVHYFCSYECRDKYLKKLKADKGIPPQ